MREVIEIADEIVKVKKAKETAAKKITRCDVRLAELDAELQEAKKKSK